MSNGGTRHKILKILLKMSNIKKIKEELNPTVSPYFSPKKNRNQRVVSTAVGRVKQEPIKEEVIEKRPPNKKKSVPKRTLTENLIKNLTEPLAEAVPIKTEELLPPESKLVKWEPKRWRDTLANLTKMRALHKAPVDDMGCEKCSDHEVDDKTRRYHILISLMLSSQTKDATTFAAMQRLREHGLTVAHIVETPDETLEKLLVPVSFYRNKAKYIKRASQLLLDEYDGDIPATIDGLIKLPGVGPKMAHICMNAAWNEVTGIGVDIHVHRIANRLKWVEKATKEPEQTRKALEAWLPYELWGEINLMLVGFGQTICLPRFPLCDSCLNNEICPSREYKASGSTSKKSPKKK